MNRAESWDRDDEQTLRTAFRDEAPLECPRCTIPLDQRRVPPRSDVSYVRDRVWVMCPSCHRTIVLDKRHPG